MNNELISAVKQIGKATIKNGPRLYSRGVIIQNGSLHVTDGFGLIRCKPSFSVGEDRMVYANMDPNETKAPTIGPVMPERNGNTWKQELLESAKDLMALAKNTKTGYVKLSSECVTYTRDMRGGCLNVGVLNNLLKGLPKKAELMEVYLTDDGRYEFVFCDTDEWSIMLCATRD